MKKQVFVINGPGGVGKDTLCAMAAKHFKVKNVSSITPIKEIATQCGWGGEKTDRARKFLADLKALTVEYNDYPTKWITKEYEDFLSSDEEIMFVHIREGAEIRKFVEATDGRAITLLVRGGERLSRNRGNKAYGNAADDEVEQYAYDCYYTNDRPLSETKTVFADLLKQWLEN